MNAKSLSFEWLGRGTGGRLGRGRHGPGSQQRGRAGETDRALAVAVVEDADDANNGPRRHRVDGRRRIEGNPCRDVLQESGAPGVEEAERS